jgi:hypothetical protein
MTMCATSSYTLDIALACSVTHHIFMFVNCLSVLMFTFSGKLLQTVKLLTCVRGISSSWTTVFQPKDSKLHTECKSHDRLWRVFTLATVAVLTCTPELQNITTTNLMSWCTNSGLYNSRTVGEAKLPPCGVIPVSWNQPQKVKSVALKWVITRCQNPEHWGS